MQKDPQKVVYQTFYWKKTLIAHSDCAFTREQDSGYGIRGSNLLRLGVKENGEKVYHLLDGVSRSHKLVCRGVFASEVLGAVAAADDLIAMAFTLREAAEGPEDSAEQKGWFVDNPITIRTMLSTDSMG